MHSPSTIVVEADVDVGGVVGHPDVPFHLRTQARQVEGVTGLDAQRGVVAVGGVAVDLEVPAALQDVDPVRTVVRDRVRD